MIHAAFALTLLSGPSFAIESVNVFDGERRLEDRTVVIRDGRIASISTNAPPAGLDTVDGRGNTLLPCLIDAHSHVFGNALQDALRFGVCTTLDMFTQESFATAQREGRDTLERRERADLYSSGTLATAPGGHGTEYGLKIETLTDTEDVADWIRARVEAGADYIKIVYQHPNHAGDLPSIDRETMRALIEAAHANDLLAVVHVQEVASARDAVEAGADGLAHTLIDREAPDALLAEMKKRGVFVISTLGVMSNLDRSRRPTLPGHLRARLSGEQRGSLDMPWPGAEKPELFGHARANIARFRAGGIPVLAGSDAPNPGTAHGVSLLTELALLVDAGLTAEEALAAATSVPARVFSLEGRGRIRPGARADLILVRGDPTRDIRRMEHIERVWKNGYPVRTALPQGGPERVDPMTVSDFEAGLTSAWGVPWSASSDQMMGGKSSAQVALAQGKRGKALKINGTIEPGFMAPWSGAFVSFAADWSALRDLSGLEHVSFDVRGTAGTYRFMVFGEAMNAPPAEGTFEVTPDWKQVRLPLTAVRGLDPRAVRAVGVSATLNGESKSFEVLIDNVRFE